MCNVFVWMLYAQCESFCLCLELLKIYPWFNLSSDVLLVFFFFTSLPLVTHRLGMSDRQYPMFSNYPFKNVAHSEKVVL